jgi:hypothetical protein
VLTVAMNAKFHSSRQRVALFTVENVLRNVGHQEDGSVCENARAICTIEKWEVPSVFSLETTQMLILTRIRVGVGNKNIA